MKLLFVAQRYGREVAGGAELHCRQFATALAGRGHDVHALSSCAISYLDWANEYPPGDSVLDGVAVHRLPVLRPRDVELFGKLNGRTVWGYRLRPLVLQRQWMLAQGPLLPELAPWLVERASSFDAVVFFTYLYYTTWAGLPAAAGRTATVLHPTAHQEPQLDLSLFDPTLRLPTLCAYSTSEEQALIAARTGGPRPGEVVGIGVDLEARGDGAAFRSRYELGDRPYLLFIGRVDPGKGSLELCEYFATYKGRRPGPLALVVVGDAVSTLPPHPDIVTTGYVAEATKRDALDGALALAQPSYFESFSMVLAEAWAQSRPALVQGRCDVLVGQARRSRGAIPYTGYAEFEAALDRLVASPELGRALGRAGREWVAGQYAWPDVMARYERLLGRAMVRYSRSTGGPVGRPAGDSLSPMSGERP
jgi:glycosyltransferase involved in cell wall biosynthesis